MNENVVLCGAFVCLFFGCGERPVSSVPGPANQQPVRDEPILAESFLLKRELLTLALEAALTREDGADEKTLRGELPGIIDARIEQTRSTSRWFLMLSREEEAELQKGMPADDVASRIAVAQAFFNEFQLKRSLLVDRLLPLHEAGNLSPIRTELLAHLIVADKEAAESALVN